MIKIQIEELESFNGSYFNYRDSSELQKPTSTNSVVVRFYKYVQAARDGQDQRNCLRLYPACSINTEAS